MRTAPRPLVVGVGNPFRRDDGVGPAVVAALDGGCEADLAVLDGEPARLLEAWDGRHLVIVVDAVRTGAEPGTLHRLVIGADALPAAPSGGGTHGAGVAEAVAMATVLDRLPARIVVVGVEASDLREGPGLSGPVEAAVDAARRRVVEELEGERPCA